jgi:hypothetical protein
MIPFVFPVFDVCSGNKRREILDILDHRALGRRSTFFLGLGRDSLRECGLGWHSGGLREGVVQCERVHEYRGMYWYGSSDTVPQEPNEGLGDQGETSDDELEEPHDKISVVMVEEFEKEGKVLMGDIVDVCAEP